MATYLPNGSSCGAPVGVRTSPGGEGSSAAGLLLYKANAQVVA